MLTKIKKDGLTMKKYGDILLRAIMTGFAIGLGGTVYLSCENKYLGAFLFGLGLFVILSFDFALFTGKVGYAVENKPSYVTDLALIWLGNLIGTAVFGVMIAHTRAGESLKNSAAAICETKLSDGLLSILILAFFCGMLMFIAADGYKRITNQAGQMLAVFLPVMVFILSGYEHCVANMFYYTIGGVWSAKAVLYLAVMTLGNALGGMFIPFVRKWFAK